MGPVVDAGRRLPDQQTTGLKSVELLSRDLAMLATATKYDLDDRADRFRSNADLIRLFFELAEIAGIDLFVEAGAKEATASRRAKRRYKGARVVAFEANPYTYRLFADHNAMIEYLQLALSDRIGPMTFHVHRDPDGAPVANGQGSLLKRDKSAVDRERGFHEVTVQATTLDAFFAGSDFGRAALWIDSEGGLKFILPGAREVLRRTAVMLVEVEDQNFWGIDHWLRDHVVSYLYDLGFVPVARDFEFVHQYNIVFVRSELLSGATRMRSALARFVSRAYDGASPRSSGSRGAPVRPWYRSAASRIHQVLGSVRRLVRLSPRD